MCNFHKMTSARTGISSAGALTTNRRNHLMSEAVSKYSKLTPEQKEKRIAQSKAYYEKNKAKIRAREKRRYELEGERIKASQRAYNKTDNARDVARARRKRNAEHNKVKMAPYYREYANKNKERRAVNRRAWEKKRKESDPHFKLRCLLKTRIGNAVRNQHGKKAIKTIELIGCSIEHLRKHLESKFLPGMSWKNWTTFGWHIDHIRACATYDLSDPEQQKSCFHWTNLQPLWWRDNIIKGDSTPACTSPISIQSSSAPACGPAA